MYSYIFNLDKQVWGQNDLDRKIDLLNELVFQTLDYDINKSKFYINEIYGILNYHSYDKGKAVCEANQAYMMWYTEGKQNEAEVVLKSSIDKLREIGEGEALAYALVIKAFFSLNVWKSERVLQLANEGIQLLKDTESSLKAWYHYLFGYYYLTIEDLAESSLHFMKAENIFNALRHEMGVGRVYSGFSSVHFKNKNFKEAKHYAEDALHIYEEINYSLGVARAKYDLAKIEIIGGNIERGIKQLEHSLLLKRRSSHPHAIVSALIELGKAHTLNNEFDPAELYLLEAKELANKIHCEIKLSKIEKALADVYLDTVF